MTLFRRFALFLAGYISWAIVAFFIANLNGVFVEGLLYWFPSTFNYFIVWHLPGIVLGLLLDRFKAEKKYFLAAAALVVAGLLFNVSLVSYSPSIPVEAYERYAKEVGLKLCGVYETKPGINRIVYSEVLSQNTTCYIVILRPEPRGQYVARILDWGHRTAPTPDSPTNIYIFDGFPNPDIWFYRLIKEIRGEYYRILNFNPVTVGDGPFVINQWPIGRAPRADLVYWYYFKQTEHGPAKVNVTMWLTVEMVYKPTWGRLS